MSSLDELLADPKARRKAFRAHPVMSVQAVFLTIPVLELFDVVEDFVVSRGTGAWVEGASGIGKSTAIEYFAVELRLRIEDIIVYDFEVQTEHVSSVRSFFYALVKVVDHPHRTGETHQLRERVINKMIDDAKQASATAVVLLIDEAQALRISDLRFLKDVYNRLKKEGLLLISIFMGQSPDMGDLMRSLKSGKTVDLYGRFALKPLTLRGFSKLEDFIDVFASIDAELAGPHQVSATQLAVPLAWRAGYRLEQEAARFKQIVWQVVRVRGKARSLPARQLFRTIRLFLLAASREDGSGQDFPDALWVDAIREAALEDAAILAHESGAKRTGPRPKAVHL